MLYIYEICEYAMFYMWVFGGGFLSFDMLYIMVLGSWIHAGIMRFTTLYCLPNIIAGMSM
jgi:hypothetical protein